MNDKSAFSITEIFVVILIMGVLAAMAIPNYITGLNRTNARNALDNLLAIKNSQIVYAEAHNAYYKLSDDTPVDDTINLNQNLYLNITPDAQTIYFCNSSSICHATRSGNGGFDIGLDLSLPINRVGVNLVYCNNSGPDATYNPCCIIPAGGTQTTGSICP